VSVGRGDCGKRWLRLSRLGVCLGRGEDPREGVALGVFAEAGPADGHDPRAWGL
jgi:hypothetical protein